jgi:N-acetylglucosaminyldiphosphoundecaprenol N-acetyl-beta-D-mannosaminyltransferase
MNDMLHPGPDSTNDPTTSSERSIGPAVVWVPTTATAPPTPGTSARRLPEAVLPGKSYERVRIWGLSLACLTYQETLEQVDALIDRRQPSYFITANLHYAMLSHSDPRLQTINQNAAFLLADGMPMVWYSRLKWRQLPHRVAGSDLIYLLCERAAARGFRVFLLGGAPSVAEEAARNLQSLYDGLQIVGIEAPAMDQLSADETQQLIARIRRARPDLLLVALGQPKGELWLAEHCPALGVPACVQLGASFDFVAGRVRRAPRWMQRTGLEWLYRSLCEPRRMLPRYYQDARFLLRMLLRDLGTLLRGKRG